MASFDPYSQTVEFLAGDGKTPIKVPVPLIDAFNEESVSISINYGTQLGACVIMLLVLLIMTPSNKFRRPSTILHIVALVFCSIRMILLVFFFTSPFNEFYNYWAADYSAVEDYQYHVSVAGNSFSLLLVVAIELALMNQAWTMIYLWPSIAKYILVTISAGITLLTISWRFAYTVFLSKAIYAAESARPIRWIVQWAIITNAVSICWFCALFNIRLLMHLVSNRRILPSCQSLTPMDVLVMTNGLLMIIPVIFTGLEWGDFPNFEAASLTLSSVTLILPLGTLAAQRLSTSYGLEYDPSAHTHAIVPMGSMGTHGSQQPLKAFSSFASSSRTGNTPQVSISSYCEGGMSNGRSRDPIDVELGQIDGDTLHGSQVRIDRGFEQREERL